MTRRILVFEWICGGGVSDPKLREKLRPEGRAMLRAVAEDVGQLADTTAVVPADEPADVADLRGSVEIVPALGRPWATLLASAAAGCEAVIAIAPESDGILAELASWFDHELQDVKWCGPATSLVAQLSDKVATRKFFDQGCFPPRVELGGRKHPVAIVVKPVQSCGSDGVRKIAAGALCPADANDLFAEEFVEGQPSSAFCCSLKRDKSSGAFDVWPVVRQQISDSEGQLCYEGGRLIVSNRHSTIQSSFADPRLRDPVGRLVADEQSFFGIDFIDTAGGAVLLEINPRVTTSYIGYRAATDDNLATWLLGEGTRPVRWNVGTWSWTPDGTVTREQ